MLNEMKNETKNKLDKKHYLLILPYFICQWKIYYSIHLQKQIIYIIKAT